MKRSAISAECTAGDSRRLQPLAFVPPPTIEPARIHRRPPPADHHSFRRRLPNQLAFRNRAPIAGGLDTDRVLSAADRGSRSHSPPAARKPLAFVPPPTVERKKERPEKSENDERSGKTGRN
eukprot:Pompholyxophrys_punicea_v1_NODE_2_length_10808_cov_35.677950.p8 type:complete len:122 gc:universal NODE_2_length_10808_cov_35.677950:4371-4736(+)